MHDPAPFAWWYAGGDAFGFERRAVFIAVIALVGYHDFGIRQFRIGDLGPDMIGYLASCQRHDDGFAFAIDDRMKLGIQAAFCPSNMAGYIPFFARLEAVRWALR